MRLLVTGKHGQVVTALHERVAGSDVALVPLGRPEVDFRDASRVEAAVADADVDAVVNCAAYTSVDRAEAEADLAYAVNAEAAGAVARGAARRGRPLVHLSTDYVFDGTLDRPYRETDPVGPVGVYGRTKLAGEQAVEAARGRAVVLRTAWVYAPFGSNFVRTMLRLGETRDSVRVVADQIGTPTAAHDLADAVLRIVRSLVARPQDEALVGTFHAAGQGEASWADLADAIFATAARHGRRPVLVERITTAEYPTAARRPANSRLDGSRLAASTGIALPFWRASLETCVARLCASPRT